ncbi:MAG: helix-turn-helix domain-containing protein [Solirubrobacteraceae bacterium]|jgi:AcrR family transcriptional regulator
MARPRLTERQRADADARRRSAILAGMASAVGERGYAATTIADVAAAARVSKSAVYAHFADKEEIFLELYRAASEQLLRLIREADHSAREAGLGWLERVEMTVRAYLSSMKAGGDLARPLLVEVPAVSERGRQMRRAVIDRYIEELAAIAASLAEEYDTLRIPSRPALLIAVAGANELLLQALELDTPWDVDDLTATILEIIELVMRR